MICINANFLVNGILKDDSIFACIINKFITEFPINGYLFNAGLNEFTNKKWICSFEIFNR